MCKSRQTQRGSVMIIAMLTISFLAALAVAVLNPVGTSEHVSDENYRFKRATMAADSAAERIKWAMCQDGAVAADGCSPCFVKVDGVNLTWFPLRTLQENEYVDQAGVTFPSLDELGPDGLPKYRMDHPDPMFRPEVIGFDEYQARYIAYTTEDGTGNAITYISAEYQGEVRNMRVSYHRMFASQMPHRSYLHAAYAANDWSGEVFTFLLEGGIQRITLDQDTLDNLMADGDLSAKGTINIQQKRSKGYLGFPIPNVKLKEGTVPTLKIYCNNVPANNKVVVKVHDLGAPVSGFVNKEDAGEVIGAIEVDGNDIKHAYVPFELDPAMFEKYAGDNLYMTFSFEAAADVGGIGDGSTAGNLGPQSAIHFKFKDQPPALEFETEYGADEINGDIFIDGNADISDGSVTGDTLATGDVWGDGSGEETPGTGDIEAPDLSKDGEWYATLDMLDDGLYSTNPSIITEMSDKVNDGVIGSIVTQTDSNTYTIGDSEVVDVSNDSALIIVPDAINNKALYVPGDLWFATSAGRTIDFITESGDQANLTFIVEGNTYMPDGFNTGEHPKLDGIDTGLVSIISIQDEKRDPETDSTGNIYYGDPTASDGTIDPVKAYLYAEKDFEWIADAVNEGEFSITGNLTAGGVIDFTARDHATSFTPLTLDFDPTILDPEFRSSMPALPPDNGDELIPGSPYFQGGTQYIE